MRLVVASMVLLGVPAATFAQAGRSAGTGKMKEAGPVLSNNDLAAVSPAFDKYTRGPLSELWRRLDLSPRDRSMVTVAALIARNQTGELSQHLNLALDNGVKPGEISEVIAHLAFYCGWPNAMAAASVTQDVFRRLGVKADQLPPAQTKLLPIDEAAEAQRAAGVQQNFGAVAPAVVEYTTDVLFRDLWLRPGLAPRDRSVITVSALIAMGQAGAVSYHLSRAMDNGLTKAQASEVLIHLAFYAGWPNVFAALPVAKAVLEARTQ
jgi:4-carboxymuconolactone decarboxylase